MRSAKLSWIKCGAILALCAGMFVGCAPSEKARPGTLSRWERQLGRPSKPERKVADTAPRCLKDRVKDSAFLHQEVARLEKSGGGTAVAGTWEGKDLATFAPTQAQFLSENTGWIATVGFDFSSCHDLPCILNQVYGAGAADQGWKVYYFYLAMGYSLSCRDYVPKTSARWTDVPPKANITAPFASFLWSDTELYAFWKLSYILPDAYHFMGSQRFHRIPPGDQAPEADWCPSGKIKPDGTCVCPDDQTADDGTCKDQGLTCADSWGNKDHGFIRAKRCIEEDNYTQGLIYSGDDPNLEDTGILGQFYVTITHEMTHTWDRTQANGVTAQGYLSEFSDSPEWQNLSGWHLETIVATDGSGVKYSQWATAPTGDGFVRAYAGTDPHEDLAETSAWVRLRPTLVSQRSPAKAAVLSQKLFGGRTYDPAGLLSYYTDSTVKALTPQLLELVNGCLTQAPSTNSTAAIAGAAHLNLDRALPEAVVACLENELNARVSAALDGLRGVEWEACDQLATQESKVRADVFNRVSADISQYVGQNIDHAPVIRATQQLRATLALQVDPREAYVHCFRQAQPDSCYQQALSDAFDHVGLTFAQQLGDVISSEKTSYLAQNPLTQSQNKVNQFYRLVFAGVEPLVTAAAESRWQGCMSSPVPAQPSPAVQGGAIPLVLPFSGGTHFVAADLLNCINTGYDADLRAVRDSFIARVGLSVSDPDVQALIQGLLLPGYLDALKAKEDTASAAEDADRLQRKAGVLEVLSTQLTRDLSWLDGALTSDTAVTQCAVVAASEFDDYFKRVSPNEQLATRFAAIDDVRNTWSHDACVRVVAQPAVTQVLAQRAQKAWSAAMTALESATKNRAHDTATDCIARNPSPASRPVSQSIKTKRRACLTATQTWSMIESQALVDWAQSAEGRSFAVARKAEANAYLVSHRKALQTAAITAMEHP